MTRIVDVPNYGEISLPDSLTTAELEVAIIAARIGLPREDRSVTLTEITTEYESSRANRNRFYIRKTINHFCEFVCLKTRAEAGDDDIVLVREPAVGRGNMAVFYWQKRRDIGNGVIRPRPAAPVELQPA